MLGPVMTPPGSGSLVKGAMTTGVLAFTSLVVALAMLSPL
jgi:hypothetical protein